MTEESFKKRAIDLLMEAFDLRPSVASEVVRSIASIAEMANKIDQKRAKGLEKAKWKYICRADSGNIYVVCSNCGASDEISPKAEVDYCWHCGAGMSGIEGMEQE